jgi:hypothetical protein
MGVKCYRDLTVWQAGIDLVEAIYLLTQKLPKTEIFALSSQIKRAAISIPWNIRRTCSFIQKGIPAFPVDLAWLVGRIGNTTLSSETPAIDNR